MSYTDTVLDKAEQALADGRREEAHAMVQSIVEAEPGNPRAWAVLATTVEDPEKAAEYRAKAVQLNRQHEADAQARIQSGPMPAMQAPPKKQRSIVSIILLTLLGGILVLGGVYWAFAPAGYPLTRCTAQRDTYVDDMQPLLNEWLDAVRLADQTPRNQLASQISNLQSIKRQTTAVTPPSCIEPKHDRLISSMDETVLGFSAFLAQADDDEVTSHFTKSNTHLSAFTDWFVKQKIKK